jgi:ssRNA-specific RNase YbeY (16S rRNA maturation enzyme)
MVEIEVDNRSGVDVDEPAVRDLARSVLAGEGVDSGELGIAFVGPDEMKALKAEHLGIEETTDAVVCPQVTGRAWRRPLVHGLLHLLGYGHGAEMEKREEAYT